MSEFNNNYEEMIGRLRRGLEHSDPVPTNVSEFAKALFTWRDIDAELAELSFDSIEEDIPAGVRSVAAGRMISFQTGRWLVDIEYDETTGTLMGTISPHSEATVELHSGVARFSVGTEDSHFAFDVVAPGPISLVITFADGPVVKTNWVIL